MNRTLQHKKRFSRYGVADREGGDAVYGSVDLAELAYDGNRLVLSTDRAQYLSYAGANDLPNGESEYGYDANGNVVRDDNRGIKSIAYNPLNLPQEVRFADGHYIRQAYAADGRLLRRVTGQEPLRELPTRPWLGLGVGAADPAAFVFPGDKPLIPDTTLLAKVETPDTVAWAGPFVLEGGKLDRVLTPVGYIKADTGTTLFDHINNAIEETIKNMSR